MAITLDIGRPAARTRRAAGSAGIAWATLGLCALFLFFDLKPQPIDLWDESRIVVNALEMHARGLGLVTTYGFAPDLWNTKPPLLVWLMQAPLALFGPQEWALRLPSALASLGTLAVVMAFVRRTTGSAATAAFAAVLLTLSVGFFGRHGARTADFDALLCFCTTGYLHLAFFALHRRRPPVRPLAIAGGLGAAALLTKSVAGAVPAAGAGVYALAIGRWRRLLAGPGVWLAALIALLPALAFYAAREAAGHGYLAAVWGNDVSGRFLSALDDHAGSPGYYLGMILFQGLFAAGPFAALAPLALPSARGRARLGLLYALCVAGTALAVVSLSSTKLPQYVLPALPWLAIACAIAARTALQRLAAGPLAPRLRRALVAGAALALAAVALTWAVQYRVLFFPQKAVEGQGAYAALLETLAEGGASGVDVLDDGVKTIGVPPAYSPQLRFYQLAWAGRGVGVRHLAPGERPAVGHVLASCDPAYRGAVARLGPDVAHVPGCAAVVYRGP
jgi:4-amino-4-deoxy-L-arabinose transferase-like glycosyltransferase